MECAKKNSAYDDVFNSLIELKPKRFEPMSAHTTFRIGGCAEVYFSVDSISSLTQIIDKCNELDVPYYIIGNGSNLLVSDKGIDAVIIQLSESEPCFHIEGEYFTCSAMCLLSRAARFTVDNGLMGLEWAYGIPGSVGGAVAMNAGAYGGEIKQVLDSVKILKDGKIYTLKVQESDLGYRKSEFAFPNCIVLEAVFKLSYDDGFARERMHEYTIKRNEKQPLKYPSAGSVFKRPANNFAGKLIEEAGLKGYSIGGAQVSTLHANFIVNTGNATANNVMKLIQTIKQKVYNNSGIWLEEELKLLGEF